MTEVHVGLHERSCYGYDVVVRIGDGRTPARWDRRLQEECVACRPGIRYSWFNGAPTSVSLLVLNFSM